VEARKDHDGLLEDVETHQTLQFLLQLLHLFLEIFFREWDLLERHTKRGRPHPPSSSTAIDRLSALLQKRKRRMMRRKERRLTEDIGEEDTRRTTKKKRSGPKERKV